MTLSRDTLIRGPSEVESQTIMVSHTWGHEWGTVVEDDPGGKGYDELYRTDGEDSTYIIWSRTPWPTQRNGASVWDTANEFTAGIFAVKGSIPHIMASEGPYYEAMTAAHEYLCPVKHGASFAYYLFKDYGLTNVCHPGGMYHILTVEELVSNQQVWNKLDTHGVDGFSFNEDVVSGTENIKLNLAWESTGPLIGFYVDTSYMEVGGYLELGPNASGTFQATRILEIVDTNEVRVTPIYYDFDADDPIYYWRSGITQDNDMYITEGITSDPSSPDNTGQKETQMYIELHGGLNTFTIVEMFDPIPWAIPEPYSIRNVPYTNIWLRLDSPSQPFNLSTLVFKVNGEDISSQIATTVIPGGIELLYNPSEDFELNSRVYVDISISCSPSTYVYFDKNALQYSEYITISGETDVIQAGGHLKLGPNPAGQTENNEVRAINTEDELLVNPLEYEYTTGDLIQYTYDDYPVSISYYFDIVDDYKPPYFLNLNPVNSAENIARDHYIAFEIKDEGLGVDISTLVLTVNNLVVNPVVYKYSTDDSWYKVYYDPSVPYYYNATVECFATVADLSSSQNRAYAIWSFSTNEAELPIMKNPDPYYCAYPVHHMDNIQVDIYGRAGGINHESIIFTWNQHEYEAITTPKIYRLT